MRKYRALTAGVAGLTIGIVFASSASADSDVKPNESTAVAFAEAGVGPEKVTDINSQAQRSWTSLLKKAAGSAAGSAAWDYLKASNAIPQRKGKQFRRGDSGVDIQNELDLSRSFD
ncbi:MULTISPECIES: hypothetical protein [Streptomyces]|uniref:Uncharacterized protein n=1 Tax=Streptomyces pratisoli TaxID=3139917 RepID=A0ACC6QCC4_9ACTN|nr:hypothetical protein [Streptomyces sp. NBC_00259]